MVVVGGELASHVVPVPMPHSGGGLFHGRRTAMTARHSPVRPQRRARCQLPGLRAQAPRRPGLASACTSARLAGQSGMRCRLCDLAAVRQPASRLSSSGGMPATSVTLRPNLPQGGSGVQQRGSIVVGVTILLRTLARASIRCLRREGPRRVPRTLMSCRGRQPDRRSCEFQRRRSLHGRQRRPEWASDAQVGDTSPWRRRWCRRLSAHCVATKPHTSTSTPARTASPDSHAGG